MLPREHFVDSAYVSAGLLVSSRREHGVRLHGPIRELARAGQGYDLPDFKIDSKHQQVTCPQDKVSVGWTSGLDDAGRPRIHVRFGRGDCGNSQAQSLCTQSKEKRRSIYFHPRPEYEALNKARQRMHEPAWKKKYRVRAGVEGTLSQGVRAFGMRRSRYVGLAKTALQQVLAAVGINVTRVVAWLEGRARAKTRISRFARLKPATA
jgi:transposase